VIDITAPISDSLPVWPGSPGWRVDRRQWEVDGDLITNSILTTDVHVGTHVEAPLHFMENGESLEELGLSSLVGPAYVAHIPGIATVNASSLQEANIPDDVKRLLIRTDNSTGWINSEFQADFIGLDESASEWCVERQLSLVGIDYISIQAHQATAETHRIMMRGGLTVVEGLNLGEATPGYWMLVCLPMRLTAVEAAPARAVLFPLDSHD
jgi:arylformamidase